MLYSKVLENITTRNFTKGHNRKIDYLVIHYTGNIDDTAFNNTKYYKSVYRKVSAHYFVDEKNIYRCVKDEDIAWHCGTTEHAYKHKYCRNNNSISVEICCSKTNKTSRKATDKDWFIPDKTYYNAMFLCRDLINLYSIPEDHVLRHYDVTGKICPAPFVHNPDEWQKFKKDIYSKGGDVVVYDKIEDIPVYAREAITFFVNNKYLVGDDKGNLRLSEDMLRLLVIIYRMKKGGE